MELSNKQHKKAVIWYVKHETHVKNITKDIDKGYAPSDEDKNDPSLWKPEHWYWFLNNVIERYNPEADEIDGDDLKAAEDYYNKIGTNGEQ